MWVGCVETSVAATGYPLCGISFLVVFSKDFLRLLRLAINRNTLRLDSDSTMDTVCLIPTTLEGSNYLEDAKQF